MALDARSSETPAAAPGPGQRSRSNRSLADRIVPYAYISPFFLLFAAFGLFPLVFTLWLSFHEYRLAGNTPEFNGLDNYKWLFASEAFYDSLINTATLGLLSTVPQLCFALALAHLLSYNMRVRNFFRISMIIPYATSLVAATLVFVSIFSNSSGGLANVVISLFGMDPISWTNGKWTAQFAIAVIVTWHWAGYNALIYLAGMQSISKDLYEAAAIDGASRFGQFIHVTLPGLRPTILFTVVLSTIGATQLFTEPFLFGGGAPGGGAIGQYQVVAMYMYEMAFNFGRLGRASAIAMVLLVLVILLVALNASLVGLKTRDRPVRATTGGTR